MDNTTTEECRMLRDMFQDVAVAAPAAATADAIATTMSPGGGASWATATVDRSWWTPPVWSYNSTADVVGSYEHSATDSFTDAVPDPALDQLKWYVTWFINLDILRTPAAGRPTPCLPFSVRQTTFTYKLL